jgi:hypothetical protein
LCENRPLGVLTTSALLFLAPAPLSLLTLALLMLSLLARHLFSALALALVPESVCLVAVTPSEALVSVCVILPSVAVCHISLVFPGYTSNG